jgi:hypothetical protein
MKRMFIYSKLFDNMWRKIGLTNEDQRNLELELLENPNRGDTISGTGGVKKYRLSIKGKGKSGGARIGYKDYPNYGITHIFFIYSKNTKINLTQKEKNELKIIINTIDKILEEKYGKK